MSLTRRQQQIAVRYRHNTLCIIATREAAVSHAKASLWGASSFDVGGVEYRMSTEAKGVVIREHRGNGQPAVDMLTWTALLTHCAALPPVLVDRAKAVDRTAHQPPASGLEWRHPWSPFERSTEAQQLAYQLWSEHVDEDTRDVFRQAFPLAFDTEPIDLFDLIGATA